jgi:hypothetical protein
MLPVRRSAQQRELANLRRMNVDYHVALQVLAVITERYLEATGEELALITDDQLKQAPDLVAHRDPDRRRISMRVSR